MSDESFTHDYLCTNYLLFTYIIQVFSSLTSVDVGYKCLHIGQVTMLVPQYIEDTTYCL